MEIGSASAVSTLTPDRPAQAAKPAHADGTAGAGNEQRSQAESVGAVKDSPAPSGVSDRPSGGVDISV